MSENTDKAFEKKSLDEIFQVIFDAYVPAKNAAYSDLRITTRALIETILSHYPNETISAKLVYQVMKEKGFKYEVQGSELEFVWLLQKRSDVLS